MLILLTAFHTLFTTLFTTYTIFYLSLTDFQNFPGPVAFFQDFPVLENAIIKFQDFPGFPGPVRTLYIKVTPQLLWYPFKKQVKCKWWAKIGANSNVIFNPLTPVPPVTAREEPWPFFLFWRHHFWPKLASSVLNFCRRKRSFQWCPDQSDRPKGALDMRKNGQKVEWKTRGKISCHYTWMLHAKNCPSRWRFLRSFLTASKPSRRSITAAKTREKEEKGKAKKKFQKSKKSLKT